VRERRVERRGEDRRVRRIGGERPAPHAAAVVVVVVMIVLEVVV
jgi:hypothetical protein